MRIVSGIKSRVLGLKSQITVIGCCLTVIVLASCDKFHTSDNGKLDGNWQLTQVDTLQSGQSADVRQQLIFWAVQADLLQMRARDHFSVFFRFRHNGQTLTLTDPVADAREISDSIIANPSTIAHFGLSGLTETFHILQLTSSKMTLQSDLLRFHFRKY